MEKKTIGAFIAALRKANGMTQKDLAEKLNVSDKTVSRWERDDGAPDLAVIPVIAAIFDITCDELLRGERKSPAGRAEATEEAEPTPKAERQRQHLLKSTLSQYRNHTCIAMGISLIGLIVALICNFAFLQAVLGFFLGAIFFAAGIVCQAVFINKAFFSVEDAGLDGATLSGYKRKVIALAEKSIGLTVACFGFTCPLILVDAYRGLGSDRLLIQGTMGAAVSMMIYAVVLYFLHAFLIKKDVYILSEKEAAVYHRNHRLKRTCAAVLVLLWVATFLVHLFATSIWEPFSLMKGTTFEDYDSFTAFMEQDISASQEFYSNGVTAFIAIPVPSDTVYYDAYGNEISKEEALTRRLEDRNGHVVCEYIDRNETVISLHYTPQDGTILPITVYTEADLQEAKQTAAVRHVLFGAAYCLECLAAVLIYSRKKAR